MIFSNDNLYDSLSLLIKIMTIGLLEVKMEHSCGIDSKGFKYK